MLGTLVFPEPKFRCPKTQNNVFRTQEWHHYFPLLKHLQ